MRSSPRDSVPIAVLGGSSAFLPSLATALVARADDLPPLDVRLHGRDTARTETVARFCTRHAAAHGAAHRYSATTDVAAAARRAAVVVNQVRIGGFAGRSRDEQLALDNGYPGDETIGPAGLSAAMRGLPPILALARAVARVAPDAWFVQMSNPMSMLLGGVLQETGLRTFGLCELPERTLAAALPAVDVRQVSSDYVGLNHQGFFVRVVADGEDLLPAILDRIAASGERGFFRVDAAVMRARRALPLPYMALFEHRAREVAAMRARPADRGAQLAALADRLYAHYTNATTADLPAALSERAMPWNAMTLVPVLISLLGGSATECYVSEPNGGYLPILSADAIVEKRARVTAAGPEPAAPLATDIGRSHPDIARLLQSIARFEQLGTAAALRQDEDLALAALCAHPFRIPEQQARAMAARMLAPTRADLASNQSATGAPR